MDSPINSDMDLSVDEMKQIMEKCIAEVSKQSCKKSAKMFPNARRLLFTTKLERNLAPPPVKSRSFPRLLAPPARPTTPKKEIKLSMNDLPPEVIRIIFDLFKAVAPATAWCLALTSHRTFEIFNKYYRVPRHYSHLKEDKDAENLFGVSAISLPLYKLLETWMGPNLVWNVWKGKFTTRQILEAEDCDCLFGLSLQISSSLSIDSVDKVQIT